MLDKIESLIKSGKYKDANEILDEYIKKNPYDENAWIYKGIIFENANLLDKAEECFDKALEINPNNYKCWLYKAINLRKRELSNWLEFYIKSYQISEDSKEINEDLENFVIESLINSRYKRELENLLNFLNYFEKTSITKKLKNQVSEVIKKYQEIEKFSTADIGRGFIGILIISILTGAGLALLPFFFFLIIIFSPLFYLLVKAEKKKIQNLEKKYENYLWIGAIREIISEKWRIYENSLDFMKLALTIFFIIFINNFNSFIYNNNCLGK